jgi:hypothetical protein
VTEGDLPCPPSHPEPVFFRAFWGSKVGCDCLGISQWSASRDIGTNAEKIEDWHICNYNQTRSGCRSAEPVAPKIMSDIDGFKFCGKQSMNNFITTVRVDPFTKRCPAGYKLCSTTDHLSFDDPNHE